LEDDTVEDLSKIGLVLKDLIKRQPEEGRMMTTYKTPSTFHRSLFADFGEHLLVFSLYELIVYVASRMQPSEILEGIFMSAFDHEPSGRSFSGHSVLFWARVPGRFGEQECQEYKRDGGEHLQSELIVSSYGELLLNRLTGTLHST